MKTTDSLLPLYIQGKLDEDACREVEAWILADPENRKQAEQFCRLEQYLGAAKEMRSLSDKEILSLAHRNMAKAERRKKRIRSGWLGAVMAATVLLVAGIWFFFLRPTPQPSPATSNIPVDSLSVDTTARVVEERKDTVQTQTLPVQTDTKTKKDVTADTFTGTIKNGYPDGYGTYTFKKSRRIDMHDPGKRMAQAGDYIVGEWNNGHLNYGEWYGSDGKKKEFIELGDNADFQADHTFAKCVKP